MKRFQAGLFCLSLTFAPALLAAPSEPKEPKSEASDDVSATALYNEGTATLKKLDFAGAEPLLRRTIELDDAFPEAHNNLAYSLRKQGRFQEALASYNRALELSPNLAEAYMYRGVLYVQMNEPDKARADLAALSSMNAELASELEFVIENGREKEPEQFFGVSPTR